MKRLAAIAIALLFLLPLTICGQGSGNAPASQGSPPITFQPGTGGVGYPSCLYCPEPQYSEQARKANFSGRVLLQVIIQPDGHATDIQIVKGVGLGLDERAIEAVRTWRFKPAVGPEGKAVPVRTDIEVNFRLIKNPPALPSQVPPSAKPADNNDPKSSAPPFPPLPPDVAAVMQGLQLSQDQASGLEKMLVDSPDDTISHLKLIGYYSGGPEKKTDWLKHLFWLVDHHPESFVLAIPIPPVELVVANRRWLPSLELINDYRKHWEQALAAHPQDASVLYHAALGLGQIDPTLGVPLARKAVELDPACGLPKNNPLCRQQLGGMYGLAILRLGASSAIPCLPKTPDADQIVAKLRNEIESLTDAEIIVHAGMTIQSSSGWYGQRCGGNADEAIQYGVKLIRKAVALDPSLIDRNKQLQNILNSPMPGNAQK
jgi:TonB family protein